MKSKTIIVAGFATLGITTLVLWAYRKIKVVTLSPVSDEWIATAEYDREGFKN